MLINTYLDTEDFVHLYYPEDEGGAGSQGCGAGARLASKYPPRPPSPEYSSQVSGSSSDMSDRDRYRSQPPPEPPPPHRVRAADLYPRLRTHYDEPGLDIGFTPICGEFVQWVGRTADGGTIAMSNYRLHLQPRRRSGPGASVPLRLIDALEIRDLLHLVVLCKHGRQLKSTFNNNDQCVEWWRRLNTALSPLSSLQETFAAAYAAWAKEQPPASIHRTLMKASHAQQRHWFGPEAERLGFTSKGAWRVSAANAEFKLCPSYPPLLVVPASICDEDLDSVARFRAMRRIPAVVWRHRGNGCVIARSSQPEVGWLGWRSSEDERLLAAFVAACQADHPPGPANKQMKLLIVDARSYASAVTNRARGGGCECQQYYPAADIQFMCLPNIHHVRRSFQQIRTLAAESSDQTNWHSNLERTLWLQYVSGVVRAASVAARAVLAGRPVLVHCSDGWDRTPQIVAAAQLLLDPYYRTREGFRILVEREWLDFGHKFADRCGHQFGPEDPNERSPIFLQWLDVVHQMMLQYPCSFEFNDAYLVKLATHVHSCMFGTFLGNTRRERAEYRVAETTAHVWHLLTAPAYSNHLYAPALGEQVLWPEYSVRSMQPWWSMFCGERSEPDDEADPLPVAPTQNGLMTKTRSCDNLLNDAEKRTTQRRCSDPSLPPDVMKLSMVAVARRSLTDSCMDDLPTLPFSTPNSDQVEVHPEHFENSPPAPRTLASNSSSLERELGPESNTEPLDIDEMKTSVVENAIRSALRSEADTPEEIKINGEQNGEEIGENVEEIGENGEENEENGEYVCDTFKDVMGIKEVRSNCSIVLEAASKETRTRNISITWRSVSESSTQSFGGFDLPDGPSTLNTPSCQPMDTPPESHESSPDNHNSTDGDLANHNVVEMELTNHNRARVNGDVNGLVENVANKFQAVDVNGGATSSSVSSESETEGVRAQNGTRASRGSQLTLCPASPRRRHHCCNCTNGRRTGVHNNKSVVPACTTLCWCGDVGEIGEAGASRVRCVCGGGSAGLLDPVDGLPHLPDPTQARLHQIILSQKSGIMDAKVSRVTSWNRFQKVVEELSGQLRDAREALRRASSPATNPPRASRVAASPPPQKCSSSSASIGSVNSAGSLSAGSSGSEVEAGEEAAAWLPDRAATRCQHCAERFWLVRRRHHCRRCGGIFCGSCSSVHADAGGLRLCRTCRAKR